MTLICSKDDVDKLIGEMRHWDDDPDFRRIADALPLEVLEAAYVAKLDALPKEPLPVFAKTPSERLNVMRRVYAAWGRATSWHLGYLFIQLFDQCAHEQRGTVLSATDNRRLVQLLESRYPPPQ